MEGIISFSHTDGEAAGSAVWPPDSAFVASGADRFPDLPPPGSRTSMAVPAEQEFERVVLPHLDAAYNLACWLLRDRSVAEDVVQGAVLRALKYFASFRGGDARLWLLWIVRNGAYSILRERCAGIEVPLDGEDGRIDLDVPEPGPDPEIALAKQEDLARLHSAVAALPDALPTCRWAR